MRRSVGRIGWVLAALALCAAFTPGRAAETPYELDEHRKPAMSTGGTCLIKNGTLLTVTRGIIPGGDILVKNGKIAEIGKNLTAPAGVPVIDATGKFVTPGIIDAHSHIAADAINEGTDSITAEVRIHDVLNPQSISLWRGASNGITTSLVLHGSANAIGGQSVVIKMKWKHPVEELIVPDAPRMIKFALGENVKRSGAPARGNPFDSGAGGRFPGTRMGVEAVYRRAFFDARAYMAAWERYEKRRQSDPNALPPRRDLRLETLAEILRGRIWVHCHSYRADEMHMMVKLCKEFGFKLAALQHGLEAYKIAPEILAGGAGVSTFADNWAYKIEAFDAIPYNAALCMRAGIVTSVNSDNGSGTPRLNLEAARCMRYGGLTDYEALKLVTINPAIQLGIAHRTGSLEPGKDADIALWDGHPLSVYSRCIATLVEGELYFQRRDAFGVDKDAVVRKEFTAAQGDPVPLAIAPNSRLYAIVGATIHPVTGPDIPNGTLVIEDSKILACGKSIPIPKGAAIVRASGMHLYPGMIDAGSRLGLSEISSIRETNDSSEGGEMQPDLMALTAVNPASEHIAVTRTEGITTALTRPTGGNISGQSAIINLAGWTGDEMAVRSRAALQVNFPQGMEGIPEFVRQMLPAEVLNQQREEMESGPKKLRAYFERAQRYSKARAEAAESVPFDARLEAMIPYLTGRLPVLISASSAPTIKRAVEFAEEFKLKFAIVDAGDAWRVADYLAKKRVPLVLSVPTDNSMGIRAPSKDYDPYDTVFAAPTILHRAGVKFCFESNSATLAKNLPSQAAMSCAFGLSQEAVLKALTIHAAEILGVSDTLGSIERGKMANLVITDGDPLEITTHVHGLFIAGKPIPLENRHTRLYERYKQRLQQAAPQRSTAGARN